MRSFVAAVIFITAMVTHSDGTVSVKDFKPSFGTWKGTLTYLDYRSGKPYTMPANINISRYKQQLVLAFEYPDEPKANDSDTLVIDQGGAQIDGAVVRSRQKKKEGQLEIVAEKEGVDGNDNKPATMRYIYIISKNVFIKRKEVRFAGEEKFIMRNEFKMNR